MTVEPHARMRAHDIVERTFRAMIESAIEAQMQRQAAEVAAAQDSLHTALTALKLTEERLRVATSAAGIGIFEWCGASRQGVWENRQMYEITGQPEARGPLTETEFMMIVMQRGAKGQRRQERQIGRRPPVRNLADPTA